ncbi:MAG TPA: S49 family peptidase, partial [Polyangia bacterium]|nr:S49 family peptidase [Polyangia bacterium]
MTRHAGLGSRVRAVAVAAAAAVAVMASLPETPARAQTSSDAVIGYRPSQGVFIPGAGLAGDADASAVELNPAQLAMLAGSSFVLVGNAATSDSPLPGRGVGLFLGGPIVLQSALGMGVQAVAHTDALDIDGHTKLSFSYALRLGRGFGIGVDWAHVFRGAYGGLDTFDAGATWRPNPHLGLGLTVRDLSSPGANGQPELPRMWSAELLLRPVASDRVELGLGAAHAEGDEWKRVSTRARLAVRITSGLHVFGDFESLPGQTEHVFASGGYYRGSAGLAFDLEHLGATFAMRSGHPGAGDSGIGGSVLLRSSGERYPALFVPRRIERVSLDGVEGERAYVNVVRRLRAAASDDATAGVLMKIENLQLGWGRIEEIRDLVAVLRARGKLVYAYATFPATRDYYLASACDGIIVHPAGELSLRGLGQVVTFYKGLLDRVGVKVELVRIAEYKGAMEPFVMTEQSAPVRENKNQLLDDVYQRVLAAIVGGRGRMGRGLDEQKLGAIIDRGALNPDEALRAGLIDAVKDENEIDDTLAKLSGRRGLRVANPDLSPQRPQRWGGRRVAVVLVDGTIADGPSQDLPLGLGDVSGSDTLVAALDECRRDPSIGAVVLRVNSPGGSA